MWTIKSHLSLLAAVPFLISTSYAAADPDVQLLLCRGSLKNDLDGKVTNESSTLDVELNLKEKRLRFSGSWGCLVDLSGSTIAADRRTCDSFLPVTITDSEIKMNLQRTNLLATTAGFTLNRYSGRLQVGGTAIALPEAKASWTMYLTSGTFDCDLQTKKKF